jgi:hypothetical protein
MEKLIYESKPYLYGMIAIAAMYFGKGSILLTGSGVFMGLACIAVGMLRYDFRTASVMPLKGKASRKDLHGVTHMNGQTKYHIG